MNQSFSVKKKKNLKRFLPLYLMMVPGLLYILINNYIPMAGLIIAFKQVNFRLGILESPWIGILNFYSFHQMHGLLQGIPFFII